MHSWVDGPEFETARGLNASVTISFRDDVDVSEWSVDASYVRDKMVVLFVVLWYTSFVFGVVCRMTVEVSSCFVWVARTWDVAGEIVVEHSRVHFFGALSAVLGEEAMVESAMVRCVPE